jgi:5-methylthioadenosine/S-adenosylhomocysteine deaminase
VGALRLAARWVLPMDGPPIAHGAVLVGADGRIAAVGPEPRVPRPPLAVTRHLGAVALLPGLVNAHAHLELTALRGLVRDLPFPRWIATLRRVKDALAADHALAAARWGVLEGFAAGITTLGDTGSTGAAARAMADLGARGVAYQEVFGPDPAHCAKSLAGLEAALDDLARWGSERVRIGVSPHAPYTVSEPLLAAVAGLARARGLPLAMHLAESPEEAAFVRDGAGPFAEALARRGIAVAPRGASPVQWAFAAGLDGVRPLVIHCVTAGPEDFGLIAGAGATVAHCPLSNATLGHGRADLPGMRRAGLTVGIGTDSVAAGGGLDLFAELRAAAAGRDLSPGELLRLVTSDAARALGVAGAGVLAPGAWGDLVAVSLRRPAFEPHADPELAIASTASASDVVATWVAGRLVYERGRWPGVDVAAAREAVAAAHRVALAARAAAPVS